MNKERSNRLVTLEEANLFLSFVKEAKAPIKRHASEQALTSKKKVMKIRFKSLNSDVGSLMFYNPPLPMIETDTEFTCTYCGAKYIYKRCLINHMIKNHRSKLM